MSEQYNVVMILSADDAGFSSALGKIVTQADKVGDGIEKSGFKFGIFAELGRSAVNVVRSSMSGLVSEMSSSQAAWKTFEGNMENFGKASEIPKVKKELQEFAEATIYSSSDMASTYSQLEAVGTKGTLKLVKGFGGLASAAENPQQAMKTLSTQATQMAAKPTVQWMDFKLMLEQTPAGIAAVAKEMGRTGKISGNTAADLISAVQDGTVATEDFFEAIAAVGGSDAWQKQAMQYKTVSQAMDGLQETAANKLMPVFDSVSQIIIDNVSEITDALGKVDFESFGSWITDHADEIETGAKALAGVTAALAGMSIVNKIAGTFSTFVGGIRQLASPKLLGKLIPNLTATAVGEEAVGTASATSAPEILAAGAAFLMLGAGVALIAAGFYLLAQAAVNVAAGGGAAIATFAGMAVAVAALMAVASAVGPALTLGAVGMVAFGVAILLVGAGAALAGVGISKMSAGLPALATFGMSAAASMTALGAASLILAPGALAAGAGLLVLMIGGIGAAAGMLLLLVALQGVNSTMQSIMSAATRTASSLKSMNSSISAVKSGLSGIKDKAAGAFDGLISKAKNTASKLKSSGNDAGKGFSTGFSNGIKNAPNVANTVTSKIISKLKSGRSKVQAAGRYVSQGFAQGMRSCLGEIEAAANKMVAAADRAARAKAKIKSPSRLFADIGQYIPKGFAKGILDNSDVVERASQKMISLPQISSGYQMSFAGMNTGSLNDNYSYFGSAKYEISVPVNVDGKEVAKVTAPYTEAELEKRQQRSNRAKGVR